MDRDLRRSWLPLCCPIIQTFSRNRSCSSDLRCSLRVQEFRPYEQRGCPTMQTINAANAATCESNTKLWVLPGRATIHAGSPPGTLRTVTYQPSDVRWSSM
jgi:hypothetical protein